MKGLKQELKQQQLKHNFNWKYFPVVRDYSNESFWAVLTCGTVYYALQGSKIRFSLWSRNSKVRPFLCMLGSST